jgi:hypothetical protein
MHSACSGRPSCMQYSILCYNSGMHHGIRSKVFLFTLPDQHRGTAMLFSSDRTKRDGEILNSVMPVRFSFVPSQRNDTELYVLP